MALARESSRIPPNFSDRAEAARARPPTSVAIRGQGRRCAAATGVPRSARLAWFGAVGLAALLAGCDPYVEGNGVFREEDRTPAEAFTGIHVEDGIEAVVTSGAAQQKVVVSGDANIVRDYLKTEVVTDQGSGPVLHVRIDTGGGGWSASITPRVVVDLAELRYVGAEDSHVTAAGVATLLFAVEAYGDSEVLVSGSGGGRIEVVASGSEVDAGFYLVSEGALVDLSSGARAVLNSDGPVAGSVRGGCTLANLGSGSCSGVIVPPGETASVCAPVP
jgi:hypothetical protein